MQVPQYGAKGTVLLQELARAQWLPPWNQSLVSDILSEMEGVRAGIQQYFETRRTPDPADKPRLLADHTALLRDKRYLMAYVHNRLHKVQDLRWTTGSAVDSTLKDLLSAEEIDFFGQYAGLVAHYAGAVGIDLSADMTPPQDLNVRVRVIKGAGTILLASGASMVLKVGTEHYISRVDAEPLIRGGYLEHIRYAGP